MVALKPDWTALPSVSKFKRYYPEGARRKHLSGKVTLQCGVLADGKLNVCTVIEETPPGEGFGAAAMNLIPMFQMKPQTPEGRSVEGGVVRIPVVFQAP